MIRTGRATIVTTDTINETYSGYTDWRFECLHDNYTYLSLGAYQTRDQYGPITFVQDLRNYARCEEGILVNGGHLVVPLCESYYGSL